MREIRRLLKNTVVFVGLCLLAGVIGAQAASLSITTTADGGSGSLRQAIIDATTNAEANILAFNIPTSDPGYDPVANRFTISLVTPLPNIPLAPLTMNNNQAQAITVRSNGTFRVFTLVNSAVLVINNLTISNGFANNGLGGGIYMGDSSTMTLNGSTVRDNSAAANGGGIYMSNSGTLHLNRSTIRNNTAINGGGIFIFDSGTLNMDRSTVNSNTAMAGGNGGGIFNGSAGTINGTSNTIDGNAAANFGGGIHNTGTITLTNNTISSNTAVVQGGGVYNAFTGTLQNNLVALNTAATSNDLFGTYAGTYNLIGNADGSAGLGGAPNRSGTTANPLNPLLSPLQDNGGPTFTRELMTGSPAIDKGNSATIIIDQRGLPRPFDNPLIPNDGGNGSDIGAFEVQTIGVAPTPTPTPSPSPSGNRVLRVVNASVDPGQTVVVSVVLDSLGDEASTSFSLNFNPTVLTNPVVALGSGVPADSILTTNLSGAAQGNIGIIVDSANTFTAGTRQVITVTFSVPANAQIGIYPITFGSIPTVQSVSSTTGAPLPTVYMAGNVQVGSTAAGVEVSGRVITSDGRGVRNAVVTITDQSGTVRTARTGSFGYYRFEDIEAGSTFVIGVSSKRYRYAPRIVQVFDTLTNVDFVGME